MMVMTPMKLITRQSSLLLLTHVVSPLRFRVFNLNLHLGTTPSSSSSSSSLLLSSKLLSTFSSSLLLRQLHRLYHHQRRRRLRRLRQCNQSVYLSVVYHPYNRISAFFQRRCLVSQLRPTTVQTRCLSTAATTSTTNQGHPPDETVTKSESQSSSQDVKNARPTFGLERSAAGQLYRRVQFDYSRLVEFIKEEVEYHHKIKKERTQPGCCRDSDVHGSLSKCLRAAVRSSGLR